jgi:hypothetical protein
MKRTSAWFGLFTGAGSLGISILAFLGPLTSCTQIYHRFANFSQCLISACIYVHLFHYGNQNFVLRYVTCARETLEEEKLDGFHARLRSPDLYNFALGLSCFIMVSATIRRWIFPVAVLGMLSVK